MTIFRLVLLVASLVLAASTYAQDKAPEGARPPAEKSSGKAEERPGGMQPVIEISRSTKPNCDVKPVMTDDEIARCKKAWAR